jgi:hypothetical protein
MADQQSKPNTPPAKMPKKRVSPVVVIKRIIASISEKIKLVVEQIKQSIIKAWLSDFEPHYLKSLNPLIHNNNDPNLLNNTLITRLRQHDYNQPLTIVVKYTPSEKFSLYSTYTQDEKEMAEFQAWKKAHPKNNK